MSILLLGSIDIILGVVQGKELKYSKNKYIFFTVFFLFQKVLFWSPNHNPKWNSALQYVTRIDLDEYFVLSIIPFFLLVYFFCDWHYVNLQSDIYVCVFLKTLVACPASNFNNWSTSNLLTIKWLEIWSIDLTNFYGKLKFNAKRFEIWKRCIRLKLHCLSSVLYRLKELFFWVLVFIRFWNYIMCP